MSTSTPKERRSMPLAAFGDPERRLFPILDQSDVDAAARLIGKAQNPAAVKRRIIAIAKRKGFSIPDAWQSGEEAGKRRIGAALRGAVHGRA